MPEGIGLAAVISRAKHLPVCVCVCVCVSVSASTVMVSKAGIDAIVATGVAL